MAKEKTPENVKVMQKIKIIQTVHDADCPKCGFPETVQLRNEKTGEILGERCSKRDCPKRYFVLFVDQPVKK